MSTPTLPGWLQVVLVWLCGVVGWLLLRPYRRITQLGGKDSSAAVALGRLVAPPVLPGHARGREARRRPSRAAPTSRRSASAARSSPSRPRCGRRRGWRTRAPRRSRRPSAHRAPRGPADGPAAAPARRPSGAGRPPPAGAMDRARRRRTRRPATRSTDPTPPRSPSRRRLRRRGCAPRRGDRVRRVLQLLATSALRSRVGVAIVLARRRARGRRRGARRLRAGRRPARSCRSRRPCRTSTVSRDRDGDDGVVETAPAAAPPIDREPGRRQPRSRRRRRSRRPGSTSDADAPKQWQAGAAAARHRRRWRRSSRASTRLVVPAERLTGAAAVVPRGERLRRGHHPGRLRAPAAAPGRAARAVAGRRRRLGAGVTRPAPTPTRRPTPGSALLVALTATLALLCCAGGAGAFFLDGLGGDDNAAFTGIGCGAAGPLPIDGKLPTVSGLRRRADPQRGDHHQRRPAAEGAAARLGDRGRDRDAGVGADQPAAPRRAQRPRLASGSSSSGPARAGARRSSSRTRRTRRGSSTRSC